MHIARDFESAARHADQLDELKLSGQALSELPDSFPDLPKLRVLDLSGNQLKFLPDWVFNLAELRELNLKGNDIALIPTAISRLTRLRKLVVDKNPISGFPALPATLEVLSANECPLPKFPAVLTNCPAISLIEMRACGMQHAETSGSLPMALNYLDLRQNDLRKFPFNLIQTATLSSFLLEGNPLVAEFTKADIKDLDKLFLGYSKLPEKWDERFCSLVMLFGGTPQLLGFSESQWLRCLASPVVLVRRRAHLRLTEAIPNPFFGQKPAAVSFLGRFLEVKRDDVVRKLDTAGIKFFGNGVFKDVLPILGDVTEDQVVKIQSEGLPFALEGHVRDWMRSMDGMRLENAGPENPLVKNLHILLESGQSANVEIALQMIQGLGMPPSVKDRLLGIGLFFPNAEIREKALSGWQLHSPKHLRDAILAAVTASALEDGLVDYRDRLDRLMRRHDLPKAALLSSSIQYLKLGLPYILDLPISEQETLLPKFVSNGSLKLSAMEWDRLPEGLASMTQLTALQADRNHLVLLPEWIGDLNRLQIVDLSYNSLIGLPSSIANLQELISLDLSHNRISLVPQAAFEIKSLTALNLGDNQLQWLPEEISVLENLEFLGLRSNNLRAWPQSLAKLKNLRDLDIGACRLSILPEPMRHLENLVSLCIDSNALTEIPAWIADYPNLRRLDMSYLPITKLPEEMAGMQKLEYLYFKQKEGMDWVQVVDVLKGMPRLKFLYLQRNTLVADMERYIERNLRGVRVSFVT